MRFMMLVKASKESEAGMLPSKELIAAMGDFNEEMAKAGVLIAGEGLQPSSKGARITYSGAKRSVTDGPFAETKELLAGFWMIDVKSKADAIAWASRVPFADGEVVEVRQVFETSDFPTEVMPPEEAAREERLREELQRRTGR
ncbi:MAG TPA: YciI family protein [Methylomirabilota bacterium]|nr:YciI family protein [Methylomirabilota bacterium]